ncbi:hypothetical protein LTR91_002701 [Friedmanniomyces endolithicus]|uniref:Uncharacterized protein n=1 Tax=Friedmanniomyces endolithicus TaxID=329885 RepID=A0AAN6KXG0_9PEZI|nr:hypothetical protein LTR82_000078 [Friedmanniomyces endolithicus]KAK0928624.1 hypothetical protein LTR29_017296 [Friedmanniomyces endolithicus]KAK0987988.1 hypothetical protein LTS01_009317 [Friedmanniomyces endolithicus]KAK1009561.1 hypothetical protein LTR91_002701 [Friedmanniomyces endolithicus]
MTPRTTAPSSEADGTLSSASQAGRPSAVTGADDRAVTDTTSIYLERLAADYAKLAVREAETRSELAGILQRALQLKWRKTMETSRINDLLERVRQTASRLDSTNVAGPAVGASGDENAGGSTTPDHRPKGVLHKKSLMNDLNQQVTAHNRTIDKLRSALATGLREIEELHVCLDDQQSKSTAQAQRFKKLEDGLATLCDEVFDD